MSYSKLITKEEAAKLLGVKPSTISRYWREGKLSWKIVSNTRRCVYDEVLKRKEIVDKTAPGDLFNEFVRLKYVIEQLERRVQILEARIGVRNKYRLTDEDLVALYKDAKTHRPANLRLHKITAWGQLLELICEDELSRLKILVSDPFPWTIFLAFIDKIMANILRRRGYPSSPSMQTLLLQLQVTRDQIRAGGNMVFNEEGTKSTRAPQEYLKTLRKSADDETGPIELHPDN
jgi:hypothetical protein